MRWKPIHGTRWSSWAPEVRDFLRSQAYPYEAKWTDDLLAMCLVIAGLDSQDRLRAVLWFNLVSPRLAELHLCVDSSLHGRWVTPRSLSSLIDILVAHGVEAVMCAPATEIHRGLVRRLGFEEHGPIFLIHLHDPQDSQGRTPGASPRAEAG